MLLLGIDIGTSSIKVSVADAATGHVLATASYPETERDIKSLQPGWAEQSPLQWWNDTKAAILKAHTQKKYDPKDIKAIGIAYQMHGLVLVDKEKKVLRDSIIWCDSRAVSYGEKAFKKIGKEKALEHLLNSPGNFTAAKLAWVKENETDIFEKIDKVMLPGDFIAMQLTGEITTSVSALSEGIFWDFKKNKLSKDVFKFFDFDESIVPEIKNVFEDHGRLRASIAEELSLQKNIPVTYKAGDQPNNALSLNVLEPGEVAATAGTSGVIYAVTDKLWADKFSRVNAFAHVNYTDEERRLGILLCINGTGIMNRWIKNITGDSSYDAINKMAATVRPGSEGLIVLPFGNGAERMLKNKVVGAKMLNVDLNVHSKAHVFRAVQEGIGFSFRYGLDIMKQNKIHPSVVRAGKTNMFLSDVFTEVFANVTGCGVELFDTDGSLGAARAAGIGAKIYSSAKEAFEKMKCLKLVEPKKDLQDQYNDVYQLWETQLKKSL